MDDRASEIKTEIAALRAELVTLAPASALSVRDLARRAGISASTAHRFKAGKVIDVPTAQKLMAAKLIAVCPCCGGDTGRYDFDPQGCACARPAESLRRYAMVFDGEEGWIMLPDPDGEYVKFEDLTTTKAKGVSE